MNAQHTPGHWEAVYFKPESGAAHWRLARTIGREIEYLKRADGRIWVSVSKASALRAIAKATS